MFYGRENANYIQANRYPVAAALNLPQQVSNHSNGFSGTIVGVGVCLYLYLAACGPKGHGSGPTFPPLNQFPSPTH